MDPIENMKMTASELVAYAYTQGLDFRSIVDGYVFRNNGRWIFIWRKIDTLPCSGTSKEREGSIHYNMQGQIREIPVTSQISVEAFRGMWSESGVVESIGEAYALVKAWLLDGVEVINLPHRRGLQHGIG